MSPARVDPFVDLAYGLLLLIAVAIVVVIGQTAVGVAFLVGVGLSCIVHIVWQMGRFDPQWMTRVEAAVEEAVEDTVRPTVEAAVENTFRESESEVDEPGPAETEERNTDR
jgi:predicted RND superfamily exporter protein